MAWEQNNKILTIRTPSGISGDMLLTGFYRLFDAISGRGGEFLVETLTQLSSSKLAIPDHAVQFRKEAVGNIYGWKAVMTLPEEKHHRTYSSITSLIAASALPDRVKELSLEAFRILAQAEAGVHNIPADSVTFHEVGALDSILDICLSAAFFLEINCDKLMASPVPIADGAICMHHGTTFSPAPAVLQLLEGVPVYGVHPEGETITPTALSLLKAMNAGFGFWPAVIIEKTEIIYGGKIFRKLPNGAIFSLGREYKSDEP